ncbi:hypothetical protein ACFU44_08475 [Nocardia rhizosphaerihabitans]|uniref:hypothetical protein n=1 Tax=Nocardia rhizosphaerihabitans TaxID=1691570 RepID=UPI00366C0759
MKDGRPFRELAVVAMHLNGGFTKVVLGRAHGEFGTAWDIPTETIPVHLRAIGSRMLLVGRFQVPDAGDSGEDIRRALRHPEVLEVDDPTRAADPKGSA